MNWITLKDHVEDQSLNEPGSTSTWKIDLPSEEKLGWRHIRIQQNGKNASGQTHYLSLSGLELYGSVQGVCEELGKAAKEAEANLRKQRRMMRTHMFEAHGDWSQGCQRTGLEVEGSGWQSSRRR